MRDYSLNKFFELGFEEQKLLYMENKIQLDYPEIKKVDNDEIFAIYLHHKKLHFTKTHFYVKSKSNHYIVYDKATKKVRSNAKSSHTLYSEFLRHFFNSGIMADLISIRNFNNTFIKKVIENKITNVKDILEYQKSYVFRKKSIPNEALLLLTIASNQSRSITVFSPFIDNWDLFLEIKNCEALFTLDPDKIKCIDFRIKTVEDLMGFKLHKEYENWRNKVFHKIAEQQSK